MSHLQNDTAKLLFVSTFLSHAWTEKPLVEAVAKQLGRRGVLAWLDKNELELGPLDAALKKAVQAQATMTLFLSEKALASAWCNDEVRWALESKPGTKHLFPVYLGDPLSLVNKHPLLRSRFLHPDGDRVLQLGYHNPTDPMNPDPEALAAKLAAAAYRCSIPDGWTEVAVIVDQRGDGPRRGRPNDIPENVRSLDIPALTFRPSLEPPKKRELAIGSEWSELSRAMVESLSAALGTVRGDPRKVRVLGNSQTSLMWAIGQHFDRTTSADLYVYGRDHAVVSNNGQAGLVPLAGGDPNAAKVVPGSTVPHGVHTEIALGVGPASYPDKVRAAIPSAMPLFWLESGQINGSSDAMRLVADLVASVNQICQIHKAQELLLFWASANHVAPLAAANLTSHVGPRIRFMEWDHERREYEELPMP